VRLLAIIGAQAREASLEVMAIYANALGTEEQGIAARMWERPSRYQQ
jgi:hypothetical protein